MIEIESLQSTIEDLAQDNPAYMMAYLIKLWVEITGELAKHTEVMGIKGNSLIIGVANSSILHFMNMNADQYLGEIHKKLPGIQIEKILFRLGNSKKR